MVLVKLQEQADMVDRTLYRSEWLEADQEHFGVVIALPLRYPCLEVEITKNEFFNIKPCEGVLF